MKVKTQLIRFFYRQTRPVTLPALAVMLLLILLYPHLLTWQDPFPALFVLIHSFALAFTLGRAHSPGFAYIYTRGYSRDQLYLHKMLASFLAVLTVWLPAALITLLPVRSFVQEQLFENPYFPLMMPREASAPWFWLLGYVILLPLFHYVWIRRAQPTRGGNVASVLALATAALAGIIMHNVWYLEVYPAWFYGSMAALTLGIIVTALMGSVLLHRRLEFTGSGPNLPRRFKFRLHTLKHIRHPVKAHGGKKIRRITELLLLLFLLGAARLFWIAEQSEAEPQFLKFFELTEQDETCIITFGSPPGTDLWVNDVYLGKTPFTMEEETFLEKVPYRKKTDTPFYSDQGIEIPYLQPLSYENMNFERLSERISFRFCGKQYYASVKRDDAIGYSRWVGGQNLSRYCYKDFTHVYFPLRSVRIHKLVGLACMTNGSVSENWLKTMDVYGHNGWNALKEVELAAAMDAWLRWRYGFDTINDEQMAWRVFQEMCRNANNTSYYATDSMEGRSLDLLLPKLNYEQLVAAAVALIRTQAFRDICYYNHQKLQQDRIEYTEKIKKMHASPADCLLIDAVRRLDALLDTQDETTPNIVETRISKEIIIRQGPFDYASLKFAVVIGGPVIASYLEQCWQAGRHGDQRFEHDYFSRHTSSLPRNVNAWLHLLVNLTGREGKLFRRRHSRSIKKMIALLTEPKELATPWHALNFLSLDADQGRECAGAQYWPEYLHLIETKNDVWGELYKLWHYLVLLEPVMPVEAYRRSWMHLYKRDLQLRDAEPVLSKLPFEKQRAILLALQKDLRTPSELSPPLSIIEKKRLEKTLQEMIVKTDPVEFATRILKDLQDTRYKKHHQKICQWLIRFHPEHKAVHMMAESEDHELRRLAVTVLAHHPTPSHLDLLRKLTEDPHPNVRGESQTALEDLEHFKNNLKLLRPKKVKLSAPLPLEPASLVIRVYPDSPDNTSYTIMEHNVEVIRTVRGLHRDGSLKYRISGINSRIIEKVPLPTRGYAVLYSPDQTSPLMKEFLADQIYTWNLSGSTVPSVWNPSYPLLRTLYDAEGKPVPKAEVSLQLYRNVYINEFSTDDKGAVEIPRLYGDYGFTIFVSHPDYGRAKLTGIRFCWNEKLSAPFLRRGSQLFERALFGVIRDAEGTPLEGAKVEVTGIKRNHVAYLSMEGRCVYTDQNGCFNIVPEGENLETALPPKAQYRLQITPKKKTLLPQRSGLYPNGEELEITLAPEG